MVIYDLVCDANHEFEGWFKNAGDLLTQQEQGLLTCPVCDSVNIRKLVTAAKVTKKSNSSSSLATRSQTAVATGSEPSSEKFKQLQQMLGQVHEFIDKNFEDVGNKFADEAISIHKGEKDPSNIRGTATKDQLKAMAEEGVEAIPLPPKPIDKNKLN